MQINIGGMPCDRPPVGAGFAFTSASNLPRSTQPAPANGCRGMGGDRPSVGAGSPPSLLPIYPVPPNPPRQMDAEGWGAIAHP